MGLSSILPPELVQLGEAQLREEERRRQTGDGAEIGAVTTAAPAAPDEKPNLISRHTAATADPIDDSVFGAVPAPEATATLAAVSEAADPNVASPTVLP